MFPCAKLQGGSKLCWRRSTKRRGGLQFHDEISRRDTPNHFQVPMRASCPLWDNGSRGTTKPYICGISIWRFKSRLGLSGVKRVFNETFSDSFLNPNHFGPIHPEVFLFSTIVNQTGFESRNRSTLNLPDQGVIRVRDFDSGHVNLKIF